ncbi:hypothetical protein ACVGV7_11400, partial [Enterobacter intestinihominis]
IKRGPLYFFDLCLKTRQDGLHPVVGVGYSRRCAAHCGSDPHQRLNGETALPVGICEAQFYGF